LEVRVLALEPRSPYGLCAQIPIGLLHDDLGGRRVGCVLQADVATGRARALFRFTYPDPPPPPGHPLGVQREPALPGVSIPLRPHLGIAGVACDRPGRVSTVAPGRFGGNVDQWRFGPGTSMTYPVLVPGALFSCGDGHLAQGDGEVSGNGIECHLTATLQFVLHRGRRVNNPVLETPTHWVVHAFSPDLDEACRLAGLEAVDFLVGRGLDRQDAYTLLSLAGDFGLTQVVDQQKGVHVLLRKDLFAPGG
jgi:acetamidase/formamidase